MQFLGAIPSLVSVAFDCEACSEAFGTSQKEALRLLLHFFEIVHLSSELGSVGNEAFTLILQSTGPEAYHLFQSIHCLIRCPL